MALERGTRRRQVLLTPFDFKSTYDLQAWFDASDRTTITIATGVSQWNDKSGNARNVVQATGGAQPIVVNNVLNGKPVLRFDATDDVLALTTAAMLRAVSGWTLFFVGSCASGVNCVVLQVSSSAGGSSRAAINWSTTTANACHGVVRRNNADPANVNIGAPTYGVNKSGVFVVSVDYNRTLVEVYQNNILAIGNAAALTAGSTPSDEGGLALNTSVAAASPFAGTDMAEVAIFGRVMGANDRESLSASLARKWGIREARVS